MRQFRRADPAGFDAEPNLAALQNWLGCFEASAELTAVMEPRATSRETSLTAVSPPNRMVTPCTEISEALTCAPPSVHARCHRGGTAS